MLAAITLVGGGAGGGGARARARARCEPGLLLFSVAVTALLRVASGPRILEQKPRFGSELVLFPLSVLSTLLPAMAPLPQRGQCWSKRGWSGCLAWAGAHSGAVLARQSELQTTPDLLLL